MWITLDRVSKMVLLWFGLQAFGNILRMAFVRCACIRETSGSCRLDSRGKREKTTGIDNSAIKIVARSCINYVYNFRRTFFTWFLLFLFIWWCHPFVRISFALEMHFITFERISNAITLKWFLWQTVEWLLFRRKHFLLFTCVRTFALCKMLCRWRNLFRFVLILPILSIHPCDCWLRAAHFTTMPK